MKLTNISFPYPVLGSYDDIMPAPDKPKVNIPTEDKSYFYFSFSFSYDNPDIKKLVDDDYADYACEIYCERTRFRRCIIQKNLDFIIRIPKKSVSGKIEFSCTIVVKKRIDDYTNANFHSDYKGHSFTLEPGEILGFFNQMTYSVGIKYDKLKAVGSFMEIIEGTEDIPSTNLDGDTIQIRLPKELYEQYRCRLSGNSKRLLSSVLHSSIVSNALIYALSRLDYENPKWKWELAIIYRINHEDELSSFKNIEPEEWRVDELAQRLLGNPYKRLFEDLINEIDPKESED